MKKLLIVDDDAPLLESLSYVFQSLYEVRTARSAEEAASLLEKEPVDVMLLDIRLPGMDGVDFREVLQQKYPQMPVILISSSSSIRPILKSLNFDGTDYVRKPFDIDELRLVVARALRQADLRRRVAELQKELARHPPGVDLKGRPMKAALEEYERSLIRQALQHSGGIQTRAAQLLGTTRRILCYRMDKLKISASEG